MLLHLKAAALVVCLCTWSAVAEDAGATAPDVTQLSQQLQQTRSELAESKRQIEELRQNLEELRKRVMQDHGDEGTASSSGEPTVSTADQDTSFLAAKISEMHQDKVESGSKYPLKLSGLVLFNSYWNQGNLDVQDLPSLAFAAFPGAPRPSIGATLRQTMLGLDASGPKLFGAQTSANAEIDFAGGNPSVSFGVANGLIRLRTATVKLNWEHTSLTFGQDNLFFSSLSPTSYATVFEPAMSWSGNLWVWTPGIQILHRIPLQQGSNIVLQGGLLDPLTEQVPVFQGRDPNAGEASRVPAIAGRIALEHSLHTLHSFTIGIGGYRAQQRYFGFPDIASWTLNSDVTAGLGKYLQLSGEWYKGQAVGGLGGGIWTSVVYPEATEPHTGIHPLRSTGGWAQLKVSPCNRYEVNVAFGQDENYGDDLRFFPLSFTAAGFGALEKNRTEFTNLIYRPNSVLLLAIEYRHLFTVPVNSPAAGGDQVNLAAGVRF
jgi:hypothetical protein